MVLLYSSQDTLLVHRSAQSDEHQKLVDVGWQRTRLQLYLK